MALVIAASASPVRASVGLSIVRAAACPAPQGNLLVSPASFEMLLGLAANAALGHVRPAILTALGGGSLAEVNGRLAARHTRLGGPPGSDAMESLNLIWIPPDARLAPEFVATATADYRASIVQTDQGDAAAVLAARIAQATRGLIDGTDLGPAPGTRALLINALFFKSRWAIPFPTDRTRPGRFVAADGSDRQVPFMTLEASLAHTDIGDAEAVALRYADGRHEAILILPRADLTVEAWLCGLTDARWADLRARFAPKPGLLALPKLRLQGQMDCARVLSRLGLAPILTEGLAGLLVGEAAAVGQCRQAVALEVDEVGTTAAAVTSLALFGSVPPTVGFRLVLDRPFVLLLRAIDDDEIVLAGVVRQP